MYQSCSCGSEIRTLFYVRVKHWEANHFHDTTTEDFPPTSGGAQVEQAPQFYEDEIRPSIVMGFHPNRKELP